MKENTNNPSRGSFREDLLRPTVEVSAEALKHLASLYDSSLLLQAYEFTRQIGPLTQWRGTRARIWAARLAGNLGGQRLARVLFWRAWREDKTDVEAQAYAAQDLLSRRGPLRAWQFLDRAGDPPATADTRARLYWYTLRGIIAGTLRDFETADSWFARATELNPLSPWLATEKSALLQLEDRYEDALKEARHSLELRPWYRPGIQATAHVLQLLDRHEEARALLREALDRSESAALAVQLAALEMEQERWTDALANYDRYVTLSPLLEPGHGKWLEYNRVTVACYSGEFAKARELAGRIDDPYYKDLTERLANPAGSCKRVRLEVPFVRQHHVTCSPATLAAISRFWKRPVEHVELADEICYDGTPSHSERHWAETHGWFAREFSVNWEIAVALLERGIPFMLSTVETASAHAQAVIGYDELRQTLWLRDPYTYYAREVIARAFFERYQATGPRGMVMVPADRAAILQGIVFPDAALYDQFHELQRALHAHERAAAAAIVERMQSEGPSHRLTPSARRILAGYDANTPALLEALNELIKLFPKDGNLNLARLSCLRDLARREERLEALQRICHEREADPVFWTLYAQELRQDARQHKAARSWIDWCLRYRAMDADALSVSADLHWAEGNLEDAIRLYRFSASFDDKREQFSRSYFVASRHLKQTSHALEFLRKRWERYGRKSAQPAITLFDSLSFLDQTTEAFALLGQALALRPDDGALLLFAADAHARCGNITVADAYLKQAEPRSQRNAWLRSAAQLADYRGDAKGALDLWREVLKSEPLALDANRAAALAIAETEGREVALRFIEDVCARFPCHCALLGIRIEWLKTEAPDQVEAAVRQLIQVNPADAWAYRELASHLAHQGKDEEAFASAEEAIRLEPKSPYGFTTRGEIFAWRGELTKAREDYRAAIRLDIDTAFALNALVQSSTSLAERKAVLAFIEAEIVRQVVFGDALFAFSDCARGVLEPDAALSLLQRALDARPDLWHAWSTVITQLTDMQRHDDALALVKTANEKFPLLPRLWMDRARVHQARLELSEECVALETALQISPAFSEASRQLADAWRRLGDLPKARSTLESACTRAPLDAVNHGTLAELLWFAGEKESAIQKLQQALRLQPGYDWAWRALRAWSKETNQPELANAFARDLTKRRAGEPRSWLMLAQVLFEENNDDAVFSVLDKAISLHPKGYGGYDLKASYLASRDRFDEALACCSPPGLKPVPVQLQMRAAWIEAQRGNLPRAVSLLTKLLEEHPEYLPGWQSLADWQWRLGKHGDAVRAAERIAVLSPLDAMPLGYLAQLKLSQGDREGARTNLERAFKLDPSYDYAGYRLFDMALEDRRFGDAEQILNTLRNHVQSDLVLVRQGLLHVERRDWELAKEVLQKLCTSPIQNQTAIPWLCDKLAAAGQKRAVDRILDESIEKENAPVELGAIWARRRVADGRWRLLKKLDALFLKGELGRRAILAYIEALAEQFSQKQSDVWITFRCRYLFKKALKRHRNWLEEDDFAWGKVGYALSLIGKPKAVVEWLGDWKERENVESWMLYNLALALTRLERGAEILEPIRHALKMRHEDTFQPCHTMVMIEEVVAGKFGKAREHASQIDPAQLDDFWRPQFELAMLVLSMHERSSHLRPEPHELREKIRATLKGQLPCTCQEDVRRTYWRCMGRLVHVIGGGFSLRLWTIWNYFRFRWITIALLVPIGLISIALPLFWFVFFLIISKLREPESIAQS